MQENWKKIEKQKLQKCNFFEIFRCKNKSPNNYLYVRFKIAAKKWPTVQTNKQTDKQTGIEVLEINIPVVGVLAQRFDRPS